MTKWLNCLCKRRPAILMNKTTAQCVLRLLSLAQLSCLYHWTDFSNRRESPSDGLNNIPLWGNFCRMASQIERNRKRSYLIYIWYLVNKNWLICINNNNTDETFYILLHFPNDQRSDLTVLKALKAENKLESFGLRLCPFKSISNSIFILPQW